MGRVESEVLEDIVVALEALEAIRMLRFGRAKFLREIDPDVDWFKGEGMPGRAGSVFPDRSTECGLRVLLSCGGRTVALKP
jgi:hypothetical protein